MTDALKILWQKLQLQQMNGIRLRMQAPIGKYDVIWGICTTKPPILSFPHKGGKGPTAADMMQPKRCVDTYDAFSAG
jgi:hypothetical protein